MRARARKSPVEDPEQDDKALPYQAIKWEASFFTRLIFCLSCHGVKCTLRIACKKLAHHSFELEVPVIIEAERFSQICSALPRVGTAGR